MRKLALSFALIALAACEKSPAPAGPKPTVDAVLEAELDALGGRAAWTAIKTMTIRGTVKAGSIDGTFRVVSEAPTRTRLHLDLTVAGAFDSGTDGTIAWERSDANGARLKSGDELARELREASIQTLDWHAEYDTIEVKGAATFAGRPAWKLVFTQPGAMTTRYYDRSTHLLLGEESVEVEAGGPVNQKVTVREYRAFGAIKQPAVIELGQGGETMDMTVTDVELNPALPADAFTLPPDVAALPR